MYATSTSILVILPGMPQTSTVSGYTSTVAIIDSHISRADSYINAKISNRYDVSGFDTVGSVPPLLKMLSEDIASYYTYRSQFSADNQNVNEWTEKFKDAIEVLNQIRDGDMDLVNTTGSLITELTDTENDMVTSSTEDYQSYFDEDSPLDWKVDDDKLESINDAR